MTEVRSRVEPDVLVEATLFDIVGPIQINFSRSSISGVPLLSYRDAELDLHFQGEEITVTTSSVGDLVIVPLQTVVDAFTRTFTLILPSIRVTRGGEAEFETVGIETTDRSGSFVPSPGPEGVLQTYRIHQLHGVGQQVEF
jgi:hypothetical protein